MFGLQSWRPATFVVCVSAVAHVSVTAEYAIAQAAAVKIQIVADGMCCKGCAQKVAAQLYAVPGVSNVEVDLPNHTAIVTVTPSPKFTLERLWLAAEKGDGKPSKLVTSQATYTLQRPEQLELSEPLAPGRYWVVVKGLTSNDGAQKIAKQLYAIRGVKTVQADIANRTLFVESANPEPLSPWSLATAVERAGDKPVSITGPHGVLSIERPSQQQARAAITSSQQYQGAVR